MAQAEQVAARPLEQHVAGQRQRALRAHSMGSQVVACRIFLPMIYVNASLIAYPNSLVTLFPADDGLAG
jgi:hypothetical protein